MKVEVKSSSPSYASGLKSRNRSIDRDFFKIVIISTFAFLRKSLRNTKIIEKIYLQYLSSLVQRQSEYNLGLSSQKQAIAEVGRKGKW